MDWARYSRRDLLFDVFEVVHIPESVLKEIRLPPAIDWAARSLAAALFTETQDVENEARRLMALSRDKPLKRIDLPEAICLAAGIRYGYTVLTENGGAYFAPRVLGRNGLEGLRGVGRGVEARPIGRLGRRAEEIRRGDVAYLGGTGGTYVVWRGVRMGGRGEKG